MCALPAPESGEASLVIAMVPDNVPEKFWLVLQKEFCAQ